MEAQKVEINLTGLRFSLSCQDVNFLKNSDMKRRCETELAPISEQTTKVHQNECETVDYIPNSHFVMIYSGTKFRS